MKDTANNLGHNYLQALHKIAGIEGIDRIGSEACRHLRDDSFLPRMNQDTFEMHPTRMVLTTARTLSIMARLACSMALRVPTSPISRSISWPEGWATLILQPVVFCISLIVSPPSGLG